ncbi:unnamed protein product, partial [Prorocentrum cordatum]
AAMRKAKRNQRDEPCRCSLRRCLWCGVPGLAAAGLLGVALSPVHTGELVAAVVLDGTQSGEGLWKTTPGRPVRFVSVPLNGGEEVAELLGLPAEMPGGACRPPGPPLAAGGAGGRGLGESFCIVQDPDPYERMIAHFRASVRGRPMQPKGCLDDGLDAFVNRTLNGTAAGAGGGGACRPWPQAGYVRGCARRLRLELLPRELNDFLEAQARLRERPDIMKTCAMLSPRSLTSASRALIEAAFEEDFSLVGATRLRDPEFIHIPRTGGTTVEAVAFRYVLWGGNHPMMHSKRSRSEASPAASATSCTSRPPRCRWSTRRRRSA